MTQNERLSYERYEEGEDNILKPAFNDFEVSYGTIEDIYDYELEDDME